MSRIFEALQRADMDRRKVQEDGPEATLDFEDIKAGDLEEAPAVEDGTLAKAEIDLSKIAQHEWVPSSAALPTLADRGASVEQFRSLRTGLYQRRYETQMKVVLVSSGMPGEGKSFIAANLALSLARNSVNNILLIDGDLRRATLHELLGAPNIPGLSEYILGSAGLMDVMQRRLISRSTDVAGERGLSNLTFIPAGLCGDNSSELVSHKRVEDLINRLAPLFDWIIIDSPPVLAVTDAVDLARAADAVLLVARGAATPFDVAQRAQAAFSNSRILGFVLNAVKDAPRSGSYSYYYGNNQGIGEHPTGKGARRQA